MPKKTKISFDLTATEQAIMTKLGKVEANAAKLQKKLDDVGNTGKKSFKKIEKGGKKAFKGIGDELTSFAIRVAAPTFVINKLISTVRALYQETRELNKAAVGTVVITAQARAAALFNLGDFEGGGEKGAAAVDNIAKKIQSKVGGTLADIYTDLAPILSRREGQGREVVQSAGETASQIRVSTGGRVQGSEVSSASLALPKVTGSKSSEANTGRLLQLQSAIPSADPASLIKILPLYVALVTEFKIKEEKSLEFIAAIANQIKDIDLAQTKTAGAALVSGIMYEKVYPTTKTNPKTGKSKTELGLVPGKTFEEKDANLKRAFQKADEETRSQMMKSLARGKFFKAVFARPYLLESKNIKELFKSVEKQIDPFNEKEAIKKWKTTMKTIYSGSIGAAGQADRKTKAIEERMKIERGSTAPGIEQQSMDLYNTILTEGGYVAKSPSRVGLETDFAYKRALGMSPTNIALQEAKTTQKYLKTENFLTKRHTPMANIFRDKPESLAKFIGILEENVKRLERVQIAIEKNTTEKQSGQSQPAPQPAPQPAAQTE